MFVIEKNNLEQLFAALQRRNFTIIGPTRKDGAIILDEIASTDSLPVGWTDVQSPGMYRIEMRSDEALFGYVVGPHSWKEFLHPPRLKLFTAIKDGKSFRVEANSNGDQPKYAFIGVRPCELDAIKIHDDVFENGEYADSRYTTIRKQIFVVAVNCTEPGGNCFCASMKTGPKATSAFDLGLTEIADKTTHHFLAEIGSVAGRDVMREVDHRDASQQEIEAAMNALTLASTRMGRTLDTNDIAKLLNNNFDHPHWDDIARRCMACANCTMVCPTCFCSTVEDVTDLSGEHAERWRRWDSCFTSDFSKIAGGNIRMSTRTRYRQWMMHKLAHWQEQFGMSGCVGCGRCITWCPVGIDITREAAAIRENSITAANTK